METKFTEEELNDPYRLAEISKLKAAINNRTPISEEGIILDQYKLLVILMTPYLDEETWKKCLIGSGFLFINGRSE